MQVTINEQPITADFSHLRSLEEALVEIHEKFIPPGEQLYQVRINGEFFSERYPRESRYLELHEIRRLDLKTLPHAEMARLILRETAQQGDILCLAIEKTARLFRVATEEEANHCLAQLLEALRWLMITGSQALQVLRESQEGGQTAAPKETGRFMENFQRLLDEMLAISQEEDYILLADLLEYELLPLVREWQGILNKVSHP